MGQRESPKIHPTAIISPNAELGEGVEIGAYSLIGDEVTIGEGTVIGPHTVIEGPTVIGKRNHIIGQSAIGTIPQDLKFKGERSTLSIGDENIIREFVTINRGTQGGGGRTTIGDGNLLMTGVHIAHDCHLGQRTVLANSATLAGHVEIRDDSTVGAFSGVHQECRVGIHAFVGGYSVVTRDALPFVKTVGSRNQARIYGINSLGLKRRNFSSQRIEALTKAYRWLFRKGLKIREAIEEIQREGLETQDVKALIEFIESSQRGFIRGVRV
ncbi:acyl-ACP--UDP-N-acetylglucosamine O-acyltransferase [Acidobacteria bacterium AH-259-D05]|nr:acyl-ACP--UDP-N-acetylglucosamine O-acyltransferase [Acidobacteria bacterium AH-259-D05]